MTERWLAAIGASASEGASDGALDEAAAKLGIELPADYRAVMRQANGGDSEFGQSWVVLWPVETLVDRNAVWREVRRPCTFFGSDGGGNGYAWDSREGREGKYVVIDFVSADPDDIVPCGENFEEFLSTLHRGIPFDRVGSS